MITLNVNLNDPQNLSSIYDKTWKVIDCTQLDFMNFMKDGFNILAILSVAVAIITLLYQSKTSGNTTKLSLNAQHSLLVDMYRHLYRNFVVAYTIKTKMEEIGYNGYPSEEHMTKLKFPMENINLEAFYGNDKHYEIMHNLYLKMRNYNLEVDAIISHFTNPNISKEVKERDMNTLLMKPGFLTSQIVKTVAEIWNINANEEAVEKIIEAQIGKTNAGHKETAESDNFIRYENLDGAYVKLFTDCNKSSKDFIENFNKDVSIERSLNDEGGVKIYIIKF